MYLPLFGVIILSLAGRGLLSFHWQGEVFYPFIGRERSFIPRNVAQSTNSYATIISIKPSITPCGVVLLDCIGFDCHDDLEHFSAGSSYSCFEWLMINY